MSCGLTRTRPGPLPERSQRTICLQDVLHPQLLTDLPGILGGVLVLDRTLAPDNAEALHGAEAGADRLGESVGEVVVLGGAQVLEGEHDEHLAAGVGGASVLAMRAPPGEQHSQAE